MAEVVDNDMFVCDNRECSEEVDEVYFYALDNPFAKQNNLVGKEFCEKCFNKQEEE